MTFIYCDRNNIERGQGQKQRTDGGEQKTEVLGQI